MKIFSASGCLTQNGLEAYSTNQLSVTENLEVNHHLNTCDLCRDAVEGFNRLNQDEYKQALDYSKAQFAAKYTTRTETVRIRTLISLAAAILLALIGIYGVIRFNKKEGQIIISQQLDPLSQKIASQPLEKEDTVRPSFHPMLNKPKSIQDKTPSGKARVQDEESVLVNHEYKEVSELQQMEPALAKDDSKEAAVKTESPVIQRSLAASAPSSKKLSVMADAKSDEPKGIEEITYYVAQEPAKFQGGDLQTFKNYVEARLREIWPHPDIEGNVNLSFTVDTQGKVQDIFVVGHLSEKADSLVSGIVKASPLWTPARQNGKPVNLNQALKVMVKDF